MKSFIFGYTVVSHEFEFIILLGLYLSVHKCHVNKLLNFLVGLNTLHSLSLLLVPHRACVQGPTLQPHGPLYTHKRGRPSSWRMLVGTRSPGATTEDAGPRWASRTVCCSLLSNGRC